MRVGFWSTLAVVGALGCQAGTAQLTEGERAAIEEEVEQAVHDLFEAMNAHDPDDVLGRYLESEDFVYVGCTSVRTGWESLAFIVRQWYPRNEDVTFEHQILQVHVLGPDAAVAHLRGGSTESDDLFWTQVYTRRDGRWLVAAEHESWPGCAAPRAHPGGS